MAALVASLALILFIVYENAKSNSPASVFAVLASLLILFGTLTSLYMILVMFKVLNGISYKKTAAILIATTILTRALASTIFVFVMVMPYYMIFGVHNPPTYYYYNITTNSDGSITATYAWMLNATNKPQEICYVGFPKGWVLAEYNITSIVVLAERNRTVESYDMSDVFYKSNTGERDIEYFIFVHSPPEDWGAGLVESIAQGAKRDKETEVLFNEMFKINDFRYDTFDDRTKAVVVEMSDINRTLNRYRIVLRTAVGIGYEAVYQSPYNENNDISYILNHSKCYKYG